MGICRRKPWQSWAAGRFWEGQLACPVVYPGGRKTTVEGPSKHKKAAGASGYPPATCGQLSVTVYAARRACVPSVLVSAGLAAAFLTFLTGDFLAALALGGSLGGIASASPRPTSMRTDQRS